MRFIDQTSVHEELIILFVLIAGPVRGLSFSPTETKFASCSDDGTVRVWDYASGTVEICNSAPVLFSNWFDVELANMCTFPTLIYAQAKQM